MWRAPCQRCLDERDPPCLVLRGEAPRGIADCTQSVVEPLSRWQPPLQPPTFPFPPTAAR